MSLSAHFHPSAFFLLPALIFVVQRCSSEECPEVHGWSVELSLFWWSLLLEIDA
jgi:hypothetical protein